MIDSPFSFEALAFMAAADLVTLSGLMDDAKCFAFVRQHR